MRVLLDIEIDTPTTNRQIADGTVGEKFERIMADLKPEAAYFFNRNGRRAQIVVIDVPDEAALPSICEPFWLEFNATVQTHICMNAEDLREGLSRLGR
ncbi:hypothetical protein ABTY61_17390 [Kitasatospora sp. NPDC096128]|uniref:hypothetical protein n=1 Tax=Kitasatospora sp. NPDC096128 TaxID=3155547 RepID=UPI00332C8ACB